MYGAACHWSRSIWRFELAPPMKDDSWARPVWRRMSMRNSRSSAPAYPAPNITSPCVTP